jgi:transposase-like protein
MTCLVDGSSAGPLTGYPLTTLAVMSTSRTAPATASPTAGGGPSATPAGAARSSAATSSGSPLEIAPSAVRGCKVCGAPLPDRHRNSSRVPKLCGSDECRREHLAYIAFRQAMDREHPSMKTCPKCQRSLARTRENFYSNRTDAATGRVQLDPYCKTCRRNLTRSLDTPEKRARRVQRARQRRAETRAKETPAQREERLRAKAAQLRAYRIANPEKVREWGKTYRERVRSDERLREAKNEAERIRGRLAKMQDGREVAAVPKGVGVRADADLFPSLASGPLVAAMDRLFTRQHNAWVPKMRDSSGNPLKMPGRREMYERLGISERQVLHWRNGQAVSFDIADRILQRAGWLWFDVWEPCPGDHQHLQDVTLYGSCARCEAYCAAEDAFTSTETAADRVGGQLRLEAA